jgi:hypothetical protein
MLVGILVDYGVGIEENRTNRNKGTRSEKKGGHINELTS